MTFRPGYCALRLGPLDWFDRKGVVKLLMELWFGSLLTITVSLMFEEYVWYARSEALVKGLWDDFGRRRMLVVRRLEV